jgi:hypothetical protein
MDLSKTDMLRGLFYRLFTFNLNHQSMDIKSVFIFSNVIHMYFNNSNESSNF